MVGGKFFACMIFFPVSIDLLCRNFFDIIWKLSFMTLTLCRNVFFFFQVYLSYMDIFLYGTSMHLLNVVLAFNNNSRKGLGGFYALLTCIFSHNH